jgi:tRNA threonylcarbamoyladenosine biosynthesis protein TsaB
MNLLTFDTSTEVMSVAVQSTLNGVGQLWQHSSPGGAQTSTRLIPVIQGLMAQAGLQFEQLDAVAFGRGPGSFTGLRTACSVAQGLAFGANLKVLPIDTLLAVAEEARYQIAPAEESYQVMALLDARMDEMYGASYLFHSGNWTRTSDYLLLPPQDLICAPTCTLAGNVFGVYEARLPVALAQRVSVLPTASAMLRLAPALLAAGGAVPAAQALPLYIRDKVASTTAERARAKALS